MKSALLLLANDRPISWGENSKTMTLDVIGGPSPQELEHKLHFHPNETNPFQPMNFTVRLPIQRGDTVVWYHEEVSVIIVSFWRLSINTAALQGYFGEKTLEHTHRCFDPNLSPYLQFGRYNLRGAREGCVTFPKESKAGDVYTALVNHLLKKYLN